MYRSVFRSFSSRVVIGVALTHKSYLPIELLWLYRERVGTPLNAAFYLFTSIS